MLSYLLILLISGYFHLDSDAQKTIRIEGGLVIYQNTIIEKDIYPIFVHQKVAAIKISGKNIEVDFNQAVLMGSPEQTMPDEMKGIAIQIEPGSDNITIKNLNVHGYKIAIYADSVNHLNIINCNLSYNWRQKLYSNLEREDISDWMSYHKNDGGEWLRYGAGIYLNNCNNALIKENIITGGQCALLMTKCNKAEVIENDFSFNSGLGIGLYRSSNNFIYHNKLDFNVRGFSDEKYRRGQDSAGILVFEQSSDNVFAYNSVTHSGDGFFLWAGQSTLKTGKGGCNNNLVYGNDFSYAPTNGVEVTFSSNSILHNKIWGCDHGIWGGYSWDSDFSDNQILHNRIGIAIEHGQGINIAMNNFNSNETSIKLWSREKQSEDFIYAKLRNTQSRNYWIASNHFNNEKTAFDIMGTDTIIFSGNRKSNCINHWKLGDRISELDTSRDGEAFDLDYQKDKRLAGIKNESIPIQLFPQGMKEIRITAWGPYDFRYPLIWLKNIDSNHLYHFEIVGPVGKWKPSTIKGFEILQFSSDSFPATMIAKPDSTNAQRSIQLNFTGAAFTDQFGKHHVSEEPQSFEYKAFQPITKRKVDRYQWDSFATVATCIINLLKGYYEISITADDLVKLLIDSKEVMTAWEAKLAEDEK